MTTLVQFSTTTPDAFLRIFNRMGVALRDREDESGVTQEVYFDTLKDLPLEALQDGASALMREPGRKWFPTTAEWRAAALKVQESRLRQTISTREEPWHCECESCQDTGWEQGLTCDGSATCGRRKPHRPHSYVRACWCRATNRTYQRHLEQQRQSHRTTGN